MSTPGTSTIVGVDIGASKTAVVEGTMNGHIVSRTERPTAPELPFSMTWPSLAAHIDEIVARARQEGRTPRAISVAVGGPLVAAEGRLLEPPNLPGWHHVPLRSVLAERYPDIPVFVEHDAKAGALAEYRFGAGAHRTGLRDMIFLTLGTGLGAGIIANGMLVRGATEMAGEVWPLVVRRPDESVADVSIWELGASGRGLASLGEQLFPGRWPESDAPSRIIRAANDGDTSALAVVRECGLWLGAGLAALITVLNPQLIVLGSLAVVLGPALLGPARDVVRARSLPRAAEACEIVPAALGPRLGDVQSLMAAIEVLVQT